MPVNWETYRLKEIADVQTGPFGSQLHKKDYVEVGTPIITVEHLGDNRITYQNLPKVSETDKKRLSKYIIREGDVIFSRVGSVDRRALVTKKENNWLFSGRCLRVRPDEKIANGAFLSYFFGKESFKEHIRSIAVGATMPSLNTSILSNVEITLPPLQEQKSIASILSALDDKIALNLQMNKTLEEMAMALYKHWFVDFGPFREGEFVDSELGEIPKGWKVKKLKEFAELIMGQSPKSQFYNDRQEGLPFHQGVKDYGIRFPKDVTYSTAGNREAAKGDILFSVRAPVGRLNIAKNKIILGRGLAAIKMKNHNTFLFYSLKRMFAIEDSIGSGTVFNSVNKKELENLLFAIPQDEILVDFKKLVAPLDGKYFSNSEEIDTLTQLRDTLLPKLISGEVRVKDAEKTLSEVL